MDVQFRVTIGRLRAHRERYASQPLASETKQNVVLLVPDSFLREGTNRKSMPKAIKAPPNRNTYVACHHVISIAKIFLMSNILQYLLKLAYYLHHYTKQKFLQKIGCSKEIQSLAT